MRKKKNSALGVKFKGGGFDHITDLEGALHTFVTPVVGECETVGDYKFDHALGAHGVVGFGEEVADGEKVRKARTVVLSAAIQMDFEGPPVMLAVCKLDEEEVIGVDLGVNGWEIPSAKEKADEKKRRAYDSSLRKHMVYHLTSSGRLPARGPVKDAMDPSTTLLFLESTITGSEPVASQFINKYLRLSAHIVISLELLFNTAVHQARNEFSALEALCPQGYVYTYDPASIFARLISAPILNRLMLAALWHLSSHNTFSNLRVFAFNDYADRDILPLVESALREQKHVTVVKKEDLFKGGGGKYDVRKLESAKGAMLVVHNNSDGFGQNIETEWQTGSLDGAVGSNCSGAGSLQRERGDLLDFCF
jgi:hypothetical protein